MISLKNSLFRLKDLTWISIHNYATCRCGYALHDPIGSLLTNFKIHQTFLVKVLVQSTLRFFHIKFNSYISTFIAVLREARMNFMSNQNSSMNISIRTITLWRGENYFSKYLLKSISQ